MRVWRNLEEITRPAGGSVITIGNFDGVHLGHRRIIEAVRGRAAAIGATAVVLTFDPHPVRVLAPERPLKLLTPIPERIRLLEEARLGAALVLPFTAQLAAWPPQQFVQKVLVDHLGAKELLVGGNFRFGYRQAGNVDLLWEMAPKGGFTVHIVDPIQALGDVVSSTRIRNLLTQGRAGLAARLLGRPYEIVGPVVPGRGIGQKQTVPTYNMAPYPELLPQRGVYVTTTNGAPSVTNIGFNPTFGETGLHLESHLLEPPDRAITEMRVAFHFRIRDERKFASVEALKARILRDVEAAKRFFRRTGGS